MITCLFNIEYLGALKWVFLILYLLVSVTLMQFTVSASQIQTAVCQNTVLYYENEYDKDKGLNN